MKWLQKWSNTMLGIVSVSVWKQQTSKWNGCIAERGLDDPQVNPVTHDDPGIVASLVSISCFATNGAPTSLLIHKSI